MLFPGPAALLGGACILIGLGATAAAQTSRYGVPDASPPPYYPPGFAPPTNPYAGAPQAAPTAVPPGANPDDTGARPGNVIGTGNSLPTSNRASNINRSDTGSTIAPRLPSPPVGPDAPTRQYLTAARNALAAGRSGEAQEALERAETRLLDRDVAPSQVKDPIHGPNIQDIRMARQRLGTGDFIGAVHAIDAALARR